MILFTYFFPCQVQYPKGAATADSQRVTEALHRYAKQAGLQGANKIAWKASQPSAGGWRFESKPAVVWIDADGQLRSLLLLGLATQPDGPEKSVSDIERSARRWYNTFAPNRRGEIRLDIRQAQGFSVRITQKVDGYWTFSSVCGIDFRTDGRLEAIMYSPAKGFVMSKKRFERDHALKTAREKLATLLKKPIKDIAIGKLSDITLMWCRETAMPDQPARKLSSDLFLGWVVPIDGVTVIVDPETGVVRGVSRQRGR